MSQSTQDYNAVKQAIECRACLGKITPRLAKDIFKPWSEKGFTYITSSTIAAEMAKVANIEIPNIEGYPKHICPNCLIRLKTAIPFINDVKNSEEILKNRLQKVGEDDSEKTWPKPIQLDKNLNGEILRNSMDIEIKQEVISDEEYADTDMDNENRLDNINVLNIKQEPEEMEQPTIQVVVNGTISQDQHDRMPITNVCEVYENEEFLESDPIVKEEPMSEEEGLSDLHKECMLCLKQFHTLSGLKAHVIAHHNYKTVKRKLIKKYPTSPGKVVKYTCNICKRNVFFLPDFTTSTDLKVHETVHDKFICFACHEKFETFQEVTQHCKRCKAKNETVKPKTLADILKERKSQKEAMAKQEDAFVECPKCMTAFRSRIHLKVHNLKCHPHIPDSMLLEKENPNKMIEIEIDLKEGVTTEMKEKGEEKEVVVKKEKEVVVKKEKVEVDYNKIETELESIFKVKRPPNDIKRESNILDEADEYNSQKNEDFKIEDIQFNKTVTESRNEESKVDDNKVANDVEDSNCKSGETGKNEDTESSIQTTAEAILKELSQKQDDSQNCKNIESREIIPNTGNNNMEIERSDQHNEGNNHLNDTEPFTDNSNTNKDKSDENNEEFKESKEDNNMEVETADNNNYNKNVDIDNVDNFDPHICETPIEIVKIVVKKLKD